MTEHELKIKTLKAYEGVSLLKDELRQYDHYTMKFVEGKITKEQHDEVVAYREKLRARINYLESLVPQDAANCLRETHNRRIEKITNILGGQ